MMPEPKDCGTIGTFNVPKAKEPSDKDHPRDKHRDKIVYFGYRVKVGKKTGTKIEFTLCASDLGYCDSFQGCDPTKLAVDLSDKQQAWSAHPTTVELVGEFGWLLLSIDHLQNALRLKGSSHKWPNSLA